MYGKQSPPCWKKRWDNGIEKWPSYSVGTTSILSYFRTPASSSTSIPLTGDSQADADILAFMKARQNILQKKGKPCQKPGSQTKISSTAF